MGRTLGKPYHHSLSGPVENIATGTSVGATVGSVVPGVGTAIGAGVGAVAGVLSSIIGGGKKGCTASDKQKRQQLAKLIDQLLTPSDKQELVRIANANIAPTGTAMSKFFVGGHDCLHKNVHPDDQRFLDELPVRLKQREQELMQQQNQSLPANVSKDTIMFQPNNISKYFLIGSGLFGAGTVAYLALTN